MALAAPAAPRKLDCRTAGETLSVELEARRHEAQLFTAALRTVATRLEALLLQPFVEVSPEAMQLTLQLRAMGDRYARRWEPEP